MASTSAPRNNAAYGRISSVAKTMFSENQTLIAEIRKATLLMKDVAVDLEGDNRHEMVKELEDSVLALVKASDECANLSNAIQSIGNEYQPGTELTNFSKLFDDKIGRLGSSSSSASQNHPWLRQFREAVWNVHHEGHPMPGDEQEDIVMTCTESSILNSRCPLTGKPVTELAEPVRSLDCKHIYEKKHITQHMSSKNFYGNCLVAGCPKKLQADRLVCDPLLLIEIDELRSMDKQNTGADGIEDLTGLDT